MKCEGHVNKGVRNAYNLRSSLTSITFWQPVAGLAIFSYKYEKQGKPLASNFHIFGDGWKRTEWNAIYMEQDVPS